jgi:hypothetical protein
MNRERIIADIENLEQALRVEETVKTGYCQSITESLLAWIAVEEDLAASYAKLAEKYPEVEKDSINRLSSESNENTKNLSVLVESIKEYAAARDRRQRVIESLIESSESSH